MDDLTVATLVFAATYALIVAERIPKTAVALAGGAAMIVLRIVDQEAAFEAIDFNVIFLLTGMMVIANTVAETGMFQWMAIHTAKAGRGEPMLVLTLLAVTTAVLSALLDNVTTVVLMVPITLFVAGALEISPIPMLIAEVLASNLGGTATLIGDPPNILIGSAAGLGFVAFLEVMTPLVLATMVAFLAVMYTFFRRDLRARPELRERVMAMETEGVIKDARLLCVSLGVFALTLVGFVLHNAIDYELATIALGGATLLMIAARIDPQEALREVEWDTLFFFIGLFIVIGGVEEAGLIEEIADRMLDISSDVSFLTIAILWVSGLASGVTGSIPYTTTMIPVVRDISADVHRGSAESNPLWWALALGAGLGANLTLVGGAANVIVAGMARRAGTTISFFDFLKYGMVVTVLSLALATVYLWLRFLS